MGYSEIMWKSCLSTFCWIFCFQDELTSAYDDLGMKCEKDAFDTLFDHAPDKLEVSKWSLGTPEIRNKILRGANLNHFFVYFECHLFLQLVKKSLLTFANKHLNKLNLEASNLDTQFSDGVYLCLLVGLLEGYFVPLFEFHLTPQVLPY